MIRRLLRGLVSNLAGLFVILATGAFVGMAVRDRLEWQCFTLSASRALGWTAGVATVLVFALAGLLLEGRRR